MDLGALLQEFGARFVLIAVTVGAAYVALSVTIRGSTKHGDIDKWDNLLVKVFGVFQPATVNMQKAAPCTAICAKFTTEAEDESLRRLRRARALYAGAARRFANLRRRPAALIAVTIVVSLLGAAMLVAPMFQAGNPVSIRDSLTYAVISIGALAGLYQKHHVDAFEDLNELTKT